MIDETLLNNYCEWIWYNVTTNTTSMAFEVILPDGTSDDDNPEYHLMYHLPKYNQMCLIKVNELILSKKYIAEQENVFKKIMSPYYILIVSLGLLGNCLSTCVFFGTKLRYSSPSVYLGALAISDNCYLITTVAQRYFNLNSLFSERISLFSVYFFSCLSAWLVIVFTVERFIAIKWPLRHKSFCTVARAKIMIIILTILTFLITIPLISFMHKIRLESAIYRICQNVLIIIIPLFVITIFNILILYNIYKSYRNRRNLTATSITCSENRHYQTWMSQARIFLVSFAFMFFSMPICITRILFYFFVVKENTDCNIVKNSNRNNIYSSVICTFAIMRQQTAVKQCIFWIGITSNIYCINFCINFLLYCVSGNNFRKEVVGMFKKIVNQLQNFYIHITNR